jgi:amphi-Trp domain-containing protein
MGDEKKKLEYEIQTTLDDCIIKLKELVSGLEKREVVLQNRADGVELHPTPVVTLSVEAKQKGDKESLSIEIAWKANRSVSSPDDRLRIGRDG